ncbi:MAG: hypothetical protein Q9207_002503 [Kuettlingeria erythrocarpa]
MSYNNGYNYSPYHQPNGNDWRGQNSYQSSASTTGRYQSSGYGVSNSQSAHQQPTPATAYTQQQSSYTPTTTSTDRSTTSYSNHGDSTGTSQYQDVRGGYGYTSPQSAGTTPLGNLAHASSLEQDSRSHTAPRDNRSLQQLIDYNRSQNRPTSSLSPLAGTGDSGISHSRDSAGSDRRASTCSQPQYATTAGYDNSTPAYASTQDHPQSATASYNSYQPVSQGQRQSNYSQPTRPASGQSFHGRNSDTYQTTTRSPPYFATQAPPAPASYASNENAHGTYRSDQHQPPDRQSASSPAQRSNHRNRLPAPIINANTQRANAPATTATANRHNSHVPISPETPAPTTVDPSHVFNHQEYQPRQAEAAAAKKAAEEQVLKAAEAEETRKATEAAAALKQVSESQSHSNSAEPSREDQMAAEMRQMIEKMRDYKSKDPSLFTQIWEQVKKTQPAGSIPAGPPISAKDIPSSGPAARVNGFLSPSPAPSPGVNGLPDLGKFPAQRRRRGGKNDSPARKRKSKGDVTSTESPQVNGLEPGPPIDPALLEAGKQSQLPGPPQGKVADRPPENHPVQDRQVIYVSRTGPREPHQADTGSQAPPASSTSGPAPTPSTQTSTPGKTAWPEHKKWDLAVAAKNILLAMPVNSAKAKSITPEQILSYLNANPSYEELCQMIESKGVIIERGYFARCLLEAVPGMGAATQANRQPVAGIAQANAVKDANGAIHAPKDLKYLSHNQFSIPGPPQNTQTSVAPTAPMTPAEEKPTVPVTKQQQARKRNILEIVDLSQLSDDDMLPPPQPYKMQRLDNQPQNVQTPATNGQANTFYRIVQQAGTPQPQLMPIAQSLAMDPLHHYPYPPLPPAPQHSFNPPAPTAPASAVSGRQRELINSEDIVQPIDESKARKRRRYNPKTIVRDVLIAAGRHPTMQPLNYHLDGLRKTFKHVTDMSDLSTFRWDLVDPGDPLPAPAPAPAPASASAVSSESRPQKLDSARDEVDGNDADDEDQEVVGRAAAQRMEPSSGGTRPRGIQSATMTPATAVQRKTYPSLLPSFHMLDASLDYMLTPTTEPLRHPSKLLGPQRKRPQKDPSKSWMSSGLVSIVSHNPPSEPAPQTPQPATNSSNTPTSESSTVKRRGRPPGAKNRHPRKDQINPSRSTNMTSRPTTDTTPARPSGLRNSVASGDGFAVVVPSPSPGVVKKTPNRRGRPRKSSPKATLSQQPSPIHRVYKCLWEHCPAELHNLETLRKHVKKHSDLLKAKGGPLPCLWKGCGRAAGNEDEGDDELAPPELRPLMFASEDTWAKHMDRRHVSEYAWKLGDGPSTRSDSDMSDHAIEIAERRQATPVLTKEGRPDPLPLSADRETMKAYHKVHGNTSELDKAKAFMEAAEVRRESFGPGMDRTGATFVTQEMNALLDDSMGPLRKVQKEHGVRGA